MKQVEYLERERETVSLLARASQLNTLTTTAATVYRTNTNARTRKSKIKKEKISIDWVKGKTKNTFKLVSHWLFCY